MEQDLKTTLRDEMFSIQSLIKMNVSLGFYFHLNNIKFLTPNAHKQLLWSNLCSTFILFSVLTTYEKPCIDVLKIN